MCRRAPFSFVQTQTYIFFSLYFYLRHFRFLVYKRALYNCTYLSCITNPCSYSIPNNRTVLIQRKYLRYDHQQQRRGHFYQLLQLVWPWLFVRNRLQELVHRLWYWDDGDVSTILINNSIDLQEWNHDSKCNWGFPLNDGLQNIN